MGISTSFNKDNWEITLKDILFEWLTDNNCFQSPNDGVNQVVPYKTVLNKRIDIPLIEFDIINVLNTSTGAGRKGTEAVFRDVTIEITMKTNRSAGEAGRINEKDLVAKGDILDKYFRSSSGAPALGTAGLRKANLSGPFPDSNKNFYIRNWMLSFEIEVG